MWPFNSNERRAKRLLSFFQPPFSLLKTWYGLSPSALLDDRYILGFTFGISVALITSELKGRRFNATIYDDVLFRFYSALVLPEKARNLLKIAGEELVSSPDSPFIIGRDRGRKLAMHMAGALSEDDPDFQEAKAEVAAVRFAREMMKQPPGGEAECIYSRLLEKFLLDYVKESSDRLHGSSDSRLGIG